MKSPPPRAIAGTIKGDGRGGGERRGRHDKTHDGAPSSPRAMAGGGGGIGGSAATTMAVVAHVAPRKARRVSHARS
ncbi:hypothetical protein ACHAW5_003679 [Stephanodiscus triporus]|uniref:Uncharacterized protein n=1 Tax=Stephanodiscus triporus TaxID=2934178 RepID=A0ABD3NL41_9STRA